ncbi:MAG: efflux RND transporter periplasmic adaptor subunit [Chromatiales bacterium]|jgi:HlyD family secretion protein
MLQHKRLYLIVMVALVVAGLFMFGSRKKPVLVMVQPVETGNIEETVANTRAGTVEACRRAQMSPASGGQIAVLPIKEGDHVKQGMILLELWNDDFQAEVDLARSEAHAALARAESACVQADNAESTAKRKTALRKSKVVSEEDVEQAVAMARSSRADCEAARSEAQVSHERIDVAQAKLDRTRLIAPFDGVIVEVNGEVGEYVTPSPPGIPTLPAVDMVDRSCFYVTAPIDEVDAPKIRTDMPARISLDAFRGRRFAASVRRIADYVLDREKQARTVDVEVNFENPEDMLDMLPGYSADAEVILRTRDNVVRVPTEAVVDKQHVFVFNQSDELLEQRSVKIGLSNWDHTEITEGVEPGELVVVTVDRKGVADGAYAKIENEKD